MRRKPSAAVIAGIVVGLLVYAVAGYLLLISPQRKKASDLKGQVEATQQQIDQYRALAAQARSTPPIRVADLFRLTKAMPDEVDMPDVMLELSRIARESGIDFDSITPQGAAPVSDYSSVGINLEFDGNYYELSDFLFRLRNLVRVRAGRLDARGRLFVVDSLTFSESERKFPHIQASLVVHAFAYGDVSAQAVQPPPPPAPSEGTEGQTTTTTTTTSSTETTQAPATPPPSEGSAVGTGEP
jgi:type II secretory pathway pseudopilin PulG